MVAWPVQASGEAGWWFAGGDADLNANARKDLGISIVRHDFQNSPIPEVASAGEIRKHALSSEITQPAVAASGRTSQSRAVPLSAPHPAVLAGNTAALAHAPLERVPRLHSRLPARLEGTHPRTTVSECGGRLLTAFDPG